MPFPLIPLALFGGSLAAGALAFRRKSGPSQRRLLHELRSGVARSIADLPHGAVGRVAGEVEAIDGSVKAPLSERSCLTWEVSVWQATGGRSWRHQMSFGGHAPFALRDETGVARVRTDRLHGYCVVDHEERFEHTSELSESVRAFLEQHDAMSRLELNRALHFKESVLLPGQRAVAIGLVGRDEQAGESSSYRSSTQSSDIALTAPPHLNVLFSNAPEAVEGKG